MDNEGDKTVDHYLNTNLPEKKEVWRTTCCS